MFGLKALRARLERMEGSLLWIARELGDRSSEMQALRQAIDLLGVRLADDLAAHDREHAESRARLAAIEAEIAQVRQAIGQLRDGEVAQVRHALDRLQQAVAQIEAAPALREQLEQRRLEMEALGEQGLRVVDLLYEARRELAAAKAKRERPDPDRDRVDPDRSADG